ncbi:hypothetical protein CP960_07190 [Malaciobacter halophilus]|uniref:Uncharacterized protein n=1 Tax=Malaciobacter halophilus TaxID=197482 RepID=A0A2N1J2L0_9BACT|nr:hypothetical protein [Malaciobacter halophilus]AXH09897.1 putative membrane protein [Malaciobacter halophilus]PKI80781.1 hypothetical protein CP960_07190 [Malaciobacter halophilus]
MNQTNCDIISSQLCKTNRKTKSDEAFLKNGNSIDITYIFSDTLDNFEANINSICGNSSGFYRLRKKVSSYIFSIISVLVIMFALISASIYEDIFKKIIFEFPFEWQINDTLAIVFVALFFIGLVMMPSILDAESSQFKNLLQSWFNKETRRLKRLNVALSTLDKKTVINLYNFDLVENEHWLWKVIVKALLKRFTNVNFYIRNDQSKIIYRRLKDLGVLNIQIKKYSDKFIDCDVDLLLSQKEQKLFSLLQLSSSLIIKNSSNKFISLEIFEYCGRNFLDETKEQSTQLISGFQNFVNRAFDDFYFLKQEKSMQIYLTSNAKIKRLEDEQRRLSYHLRNHIEECVQVFDNPISLLILYYYVKDIVLDEKRYLIILEKFIDAVFKKQHYELIDEYWFKIANEMFDSSNLDNFELTNNSLYRKLSIKSLNRLIFLFERNGHFEQALLLAKYLFEINPNKYSVNICSLYERMGQFDKAYDSLPKTLVIKNAKKPLDTQVRFFQRKAWIIVSQRKVEKKQEGLEAIVKLKELLFMHNEDNEPLWLWHYYNIKANYAEWDCDYEQAVKYYKKCLAIPALGAFEYGATFLNMSIAFRFIYLTTTTQNEDIIEKSIKLGSIGVTLKSSVGDRDEMPVVLHNQALNILNKKQLNLDELQTVVDMTDNGIKTLSTTKSIKRLGMLLIENYLANKLLQNECSHIEEFLINHWSKMDNNEYEQILNIYKLFKINHKITGFKFLDDLIQ